MANCIWSFVSAWLIKQNILFYLKLQMKKCDEEYGWKTKV